MTTKYFVITETARPDKAENFKQQANYYGLEFENVTEKNEENLNRFSNKIAHYKALNEFILTTNDYCVILESGVIISCAFKDTIEKYLQQLNFKWGVCWLGLTLNHHNNSKRPQPIIREFNDMLMTCSFPLGYFGYILTRTAAGEILKRAANEVGAYDNEMIEVCDELKVPKLVLKSPIVYLNVWYETPELIKLHEDVDLALYRRDFELNFMIENPNRKVYLPNLFIGESVLPSRELIQNNLNEFYLKKNRMFLDSLKTWKQRFITEIISNEGEEHFGRTLFYLSFLPVVVYINKGVNCETLPIFPLMKVKYGEKILDPSDIFIKLTKYHFIPRNTFSQYWTDTNWNGFLCEDKIIQNYFYSGKRNRKYNNKNISETIRRIGNNETKIYQFFRSIEDDLNLDELNLHFSLAMKFNQASISSRIDQKISDLSGSDRKFTSEKKRAVAINKIEIIKALLNEDDELVDPDTYPDLLITTDEDLPAKKKIIFSNVPNQNRIGKDFDIVITSYKDDRYSWFPEFLWQNPESLQSIRDQNISTNREFFCALVCDSPNDKEETMMKFLDTFKKVESAGKFYNNQSDGLIIDTGDINNIINLYKKATFALICDDLIVPGLINMKLILAYISGCIPIYIGPVETQEFFNTSSYIDIHSYKTLEEFIGTVRRIELTERKVQMLKEKIFTPKVKVVYDAFKKLF